MMEQIKIETEYITLGQFLKAADINFNWRNGQVVFK